MTIRIKALLFKMYVSYRAIILQFKNLKFTAGVLVGSFVAMSIIIWGYNVSLINFIVQSDALTAIQKLQFFGNVYVSYFPNITNIYSASLLVFSLLLSTTIATFIAIGTQAKKKLLAKSASGGILALIASGCVACSASLLTPLIATLGISNLLFIQRISASVFLIANIIILYSLYELGKIVLELKHQQAKR